VQEEIREIEDGLCLTVRVANDQGLHARPAARLVKEASRFTSRIVLASGDAEVDAKSILDILSLAAAKGTALELRASGPDAREALRHLAATFANRFREDT
jgi:phosphocarrier protein